MRLREKRGPKGIRIKVAVQGRGPEQPPKYTLANDTFEVGKVDDEFKLTLRPPSTPLALAHDPSTDG